MSAFTKFANFGLNLGRGKFNFSVDTLKALLSNVAPDAATAQQTADVTEIAAGNGYTAGGAAVPNLGWSQAAGTSTLVGDAIVFTASGGSLATFRYAILYDATSGYLIGYWDYGAAVTITTGNTFTVLPSNQATGGTILTQT